METVLNDLVKDALVLNATHAAIVEVANIKFHEDFRMLCEQNTCGSHNKNWMCPPAIGPIRQMIERVTSFKQGLLFQTVHPIEDSFDWEGMQEGQAKHEVIFRKIFEAIRNNDTFTEVLPLSAGPCQYCKRCAFLDRKACYFPDQAVSSLEANGIDVTDLVRSTGISYKNGENTVSYVGLILFKR